MGTTDLDGTQIVLEYISNIAENGQVFDNAIHAILKYNSSVYGFIVQDYNEILNMYNAGASVPEGTSILNTLPTGNYSIINIPNSQLPESLSNISHINVQRVNTGVIAEAKLFLTFGEKKYYCGGLLADPIVWDDISSVVHGERGVEVTVGDLPINPQDYDMWISIVNKIPILNFYVNSTWQAVAYSDLLDVNIYDALGIGKPVATAIADALLKFTTDYQEFVKHKNNEFLLKHLTSEDRLIISKMMNETDVDNMLAIGSQIYNDLIAFIHTTVITKSGSTQISDSFMSNVESPYTAHMTGHISEASVSKWEAKASPTHVHSGADVEISVDEIDGIILKENLPLSLQERVIKIDDISILSSNVTQEQKDTIYHIGNTLYVEDQSLNKTFYKIKDSAHLGTANYLTDLMKITPLISSKKFVDITSKPSTLAGYGITDAADVTYQTTINAMEESFEIPKATLIVPLEGANDTNVIDAVTLIYQQGNKISDSDISILDPRFVPSKNSKLSADIILFRHPDINKEPNTLDTSLQQTMFRVHGDQDLLDAYSKNLIDPTNLSDISRLVNCEIDTSFAIKNNIVDYNSEVIEYASTTFENIKYSNIFNRYIASRNDEYLYFSINGTHWKRFSILEKASKVVDFSIFENSTDAWIGVIIEDFVDPSIKYLAVTKDLFVYVTKEYTSCNIDMKCVIFPHNIASNMCFVFNIDAPQLKYLILSTSSIVDTGNIVEQVYDNDKFNDTENPLKPWTETTISSTSRGWYFVCYGNGKYVAVAYGTIAAYSLDGIIWTEVTISVTNRGWKSICYGNGKYVAVAYTSTIAAYSTDGITWTEVTISSTIKSWASVCYGNNTFVIITYGNDFTFLQFDTSWGTASISSNPDIDWYEVVYGSDKFVATSGSDNLTTGAYSTNGITWTSMTISSTSGAWGQLMYGDGKYVLCDQYSNRALYSTDGITWTQTTISGAADRYWICGCYGNGKFIILERSTYNGAYSTNGITWTQFSIGSIAREWQSICYGNGKYIAVADSTNVLMYSTNGTSWSQATISSTSRYWDSVCYGNGKYVIVASGTIAAYSLDGITWTETTISATSKTWVAVCYGDNRFMAVSTTTAAYSADGIVWTEFSLPFDDKVWVGVAYGNNKYVITSRSNVIAHSTGLNIINISENAISKVNKDWRSICYGNGKYVAVASSSTITAYSTDGITWTEVTISASNKYWRSVCYGNGKYVAVALSSNIAAYSTDGITWTEVNISNINRDWLSICYGNGKYVTVVNNANIAAYSIDGITWTEVTISATSRNWFSVCYGNGKYVTVALSSNIAAYSLDGITWTEVTISASNKYWRSVCYGNGKYVAVALSSNIAAYSLDGITWTEVTISGTSRGWYSVCYGNGKYVAIAQSSNTAAYSLDGITWTEVTISGTSRDWRAICYGNGKYVAIANISNIFNYIYFINL